MYLTCWLCGLVQFSYSSIPTLGRASTSASPPSLPGLWPARECAMNSLPAPSVDGPVYIHALAKYIRAHEAKLAEFNRRPAATPPSALSWTTLLTLGLVGSPARALPPLVLTFDPHHLYYLLLKFDELGIPGLGSLDVLIEGGPSRPLSNRCWDSSGMGPDSGASSGLGDRTRRRDTSDTLSLRSTWSAVSSFSTGSTWWASTPSPALDAPAQVKYLYSSCTKLPALRLTPFTFPGPAGAPPLLLPVRDFEDCPPSSTAVPLSAFKNLQSLTLEDLDPRAFLGWDTLSSQLVSLQVHRSGLEDVGELLCDAVVEDWDRRVRGRAGVGHERQARRTQSDETDPRISAPAAEIAYRPPPPSAWQSLIHLSLASNSLTFIPHQPLTYLPVLTSLDLSSNLLIAVPAGLAALTSLVSLNLSDNMLDSLLGVAAALPHVRVLNLAKNRLDNLSGLDRLIALERLDLRENRLLEALEVSRLALLPRLYQVWLLGNPFTRSSLEGGDEQYRSKCFNYFYKEGHGTIVLDGSAPGLQERRNLVALEGSEARGHRQQLLASLGRLAGAQTAPLLASEEARLAGQTKLVGRRAHPTLPGVSEPLPSPRALVASDAEAAAISRPPAEFVHVTGARLKRRKPHRIVNLDSPTASAARDEVDSVPEPSDSDRALSPALRPASIPQLIATGEASSTEEMTSLPEPVRSGTPGGELHRPVSTAVQPPGWPAASPSPPAPIVSTTFLTSTPPQNPPEMRGPEQSAADVYRKRIEDLRADVGESWLTTLAERQLAAERILPRASVDDVPTGPGPVLVKGKKQRKKRGPN